MLYVLLPTDNILHYLILRAMRNFVMDLDDSFFADCACEEEKRPKRTERVKYSVRRCEPEVS